MKAAIILSVFVFITLTFNSCKKDDQAIVKSFSGKVQKGPYLIGSTVVAYELNEDLVQTGKSFTTEITSNDGSFSFDNIELETPYVLLSANGYYFNEVLGQNSSGPLTLNTIVDITDKDIMNVNLMTDAIKPRVIQLISEGKSYIEANSQAKTEFLNFLGVIQTSVDDFDQLNIIEQGDMNSLLLAYSLICQRFTGIMDQSSLTGELAELTSKINLDLKDNGEIDDQSIISQLLNNISTLNYSNIRTNIQNRYNELGITAEIPDFEYYIGQFQIKYDPEVVLEYIYPLMSSADFDSDPGPEYLNLLHKESTNFEVTSSYSYHVVAATCPVGGSLKIRIIPNTCEADEGMYCCFCDWSVYNGKWLREYEDGIWTFTAKVQNANCTYLFNLQGTGSATIEYYEGDMETPAFTKVITWE
ncbi:MAG: hypothetical protein PHH30_01115 [Bacteroidales bacterium]|nr:hypothetical protein [Bacteroidales bacterium]